MGILLLSGLLFFASCSVGLQVNMEANYLDYPVSHTSSVYAPDGTLYMETDLEPIENFSFEFKKWGVSSIFEIQANEDVSDQLNELIESRGGDAIVDFKISSRNTGTNSFMLFLKSTALVGAAVTTPFAISEKSAGLASLAAGSLITYLFTPGHVEIKMEGTVVKFAEESPC